MTDEIIIDGIDVSGCKHIHSTDKVYCNEDYYEFKKCKQNKNCYYKQLKRKEQELNKLKAESEEKEKWTGLYDTLKNKIYFGNIVHWTDGGDELSLEERIKTRWDRIAEVGKDRIEVIFKVIDSPDQCTKEYGDTFRYGNFIYRDTENYLTVVAKDRKEYETKFRSAGECMKYVLEQRNGGKLNV